MQPRELDHVALWVNDRAGLTHRLVEELSVRVIDETERHTLIGPTATHGKITLFDTPAGTTAQAGRLVSLLLADPRGSHREPMLLEGGLTLTFGMHDRVLAGTPEHALIGLSLGSADPSVVAADYVSRYGFEPVAAHRDVAAVAAGHGVVTLVREPVTETGSPMLNHLGMLVDSAADHLRQAEGSGIDVEDVIDAPNTLAVFVAGPEAVRLEYVEHKPEFALT